MTQEEAAKQETARGVAAIAPPSRRHALHAMPAFSRAERIRPELDRLLSVHDRRASIARDPVEFVHAFADPLDQEVVGLFASSVAYGRVDLFKPRVRALLPSLGRSPAAFLRDASASDVLQATRDFTYRMTGPAEAAALLYAAGRLQREWGSIGAAVEACFEAAGGHTREALDRFVETLWQFDLTPFVAQKTPTRRLAHLVASPGGASACKRLNLYVRWMVRPADGVDLGLWRVQPSVLVIPLDTHVHRISGLLGLTRRPDLSWRTAEEVTAGLRRLDPDDPVKYDFAISHLGISGACPSRQDAEKCASCPLKPICRLWG